MTPAGTLSATLWAVAAACVWTAVVRSGAIRNLFRKPEPTSQRQVDIFLNRLLNRTCCDGTRFVMISIDCFLFDFRKGNPDGLDEKTQYAFLEFMRTLDLSNQQAIVKLIIWLEQRGVAYRLRFRWNRQLPLTYNIKQIRKPAWLHGMVMALDRGQLMEYDLSKDTHALRS